MGLLIDGAAEDDRAPTEERSRVRGGASVRTGAAGDGCSETEELARVVYPTSAENYTERCAFVPFKLTRTLGVAQVSSFLEEEPTRCGCRYRRSTCAKRSKQMSISSLS